MSAEDLRIKTLIEEVVISILGRYVFRLMLTVMVLSGTVLSSGFYAGVQIAKLNETIERLNTLNKSLEARISMIEKSVPAAHTRWTANMQSEYNERLRMDNPMLKLPDVGSIRRAYLHEVTQ